MLDSDVETYLDMLLQLVFKSIFAGLGHGNLTPLAETQLFWCVICCILQVQIFPLFPCSVRIE